MSTHIQDHVFAGGVDEYGNLIVKIGPAHPLARMNAVDRSRLISGAPGLMEAVKAFSEHLRSMIATQFATGQMTGTTPPSLPLPTVERKSS